MEVETFSKILGVLPCGDLSYLLWDFSTLIQPLEAEPLLLVQLEAGGPIGPTAVYCINSALNTGVTEPHLAVEDPTSNNINLNLHSICHIICH
jgi:hypothetical protein